MKRRSYVRSSEEIQQEAAAALLTAPVLGPYASVPDNSHQHDVTMDPTKYTAFSLEHELFKEVIEYLLPNSGDITHKTRLRQVWHGVANDIIRKEPICWRA
jgi:hypothetical protein